MSDRTCFLCGLALLAIGALGDSQRTAQACHPVFLGDPASAIGHHGCGGDIKPPSGTVAPPAIWVPPMPIPAQLATPRPPAPTGVLPTATPSPTGTAPPPLFVLSTPVPGSDPSASRVDPPSAVAGAIADLAERLGVEPASISVVLVEEVTWPDSSVGCPEPNRAYLQMLMPGWQILLGVDETIYAYHAGQGPLAAYCEQPTRPVPGNPLSLPKE